MASQQAALTRQGLASWRLVSAGQLLSTCTAWRQMRAAHFSAPTRQASAFPYVHVLSLLQAQAGCATFPPTQYMQTMYGMGAGSRPALPVASN